MGTNKCLVKQLLCLYPLPHLSQRSSTRLIFLLLPSLTRGWPSLARRNLPSCRAVSPSVEAPSSMALSCPSGFPSVLSVPTSAAGGCDGRLAARTAREMPDFDTVFRRPLLMVIGRAVALSAPSATTSPMTAATAATLAAVFVMLFRRVTRWVALSELPRIEWELFLECDCRPGSPATFELEDIEGRCVNGLDVCCISWAGQRVTRACQHCSSWCIANSPRHWVKWRAPRQLRVRTSHTFVGLTGSFYL